MNSQKTINKFNNKTAVIGIVGLGYVGLPLMLRYNAIGFKVIGIDINQSKVDDLNSGKSDIEHIPNASIAEASEDWRCPQPAQQCRAR